MDVWDKVWTQNMRHELINLDELRTGQHLILTQGLPASGKSTWANVLCEWAEENGISMTRINRDAIRLELGFKFDPKREDEVTQIQDDRVLFTLANGGNVICDDTYLNPKYIQQRRRQAASIEGSDIKVHVVDWFIKNVSVEECIARDLKREAYVGKDVIETLYYRWWNNQPKPPNYGERPAILCDLDGTLALIPPGANRFDRDFTKDVLNEAVWMVVSNLRNMGWHLILMSGREWRHRALTMQWLAENGIQYDALHMRDTGDFRKDTVVKKELYQHHVQGKYYVSLVLDDRPSVVRMWRAELGLTVFQVAPNMEF